MLYLYNLLYFLHITWVQSKYDLIPKAGTANAATSTNTRNNFEWINMGLTYNATPEWKSIKLKINNLTELQNDRDLGMKIIWVKPSDNDSLNNSSVKYSKKIKTNRDHMNISKRQFMISAEPDTILNINVNTDDK